LLPPSAAFLLSLWAASCADPEELEVGGSANALISDATHNSGQTGFFFLPPMVSSVPRTQGLFEPRLSPEVRIDQLDAQGQATATLVKYDAEHAVAGEKVRRELFGANYVVRFQSRRFSLKAGSTYRIHVSVAGRELGVADFVVVRSLRDWLRTDRDTTVPLVSGTTLPIRFRIEQRAVDRDLDGVFDWVDNCPDVKNPAVATHDDSDNNDDRHAHRWSKPIPWGCDPDEDACSPREQDCYHGSFAQPDADQDGVGDACDCPDGYTGSAGQCVDNDECAGPTSACVAHKLCTNTPGSFECSPCLAGYTDDGADGCIDIDECQTGAADCSPLVTCGNTDGGYECGACPAGYSGDGHTCTDIDECATQTHQCPTYASCLNIVGSYQCTGCPAGYVKGTFGCVDIDECATNRGGCDRLTTCRNYQGTYACGACPAGYTGTGATGCLDIDECASNPCDPLAGCTNNPGSYQCGACPAGYSGDGKNGCRDIDECASSTACAALATCKNTVGGYACSCPSGFSGDGKTACTDLDECALGQANCAAGAACSNTVGTFTCTCPDNTLDIHGDGRECQIVL
jgi:hypothetical protein